jgi:hypothetical protein
MKSILTICIMMLCSVTSFAEEEGTKITVFAFGGINFGGESSGGELIFRKLYSSSEPLKSFKRFYREQEGNNEAQMYALVAFYYLDKKEYEKIKSAYRGQKIIVNCQSACSEYTKTLDDLIKKIESDSYKDFLPK